MNNPGTKKNAITVKDVAEKAGVAVGTVSRYLNGYKLREDKRERVQKSIEELGFKGNYFARGLKKKRSMTIGALVYGFTDTFSLSIINVFSKLVEKEGYSLIISDYEGDNIKLAQKINFMNEKSVDGIVVFPFVPDRSIVEKLNELLEDKVPIVIMNDSIEDVKTDTVVADNMNVSLRAVENLINNNHQKIAIICGIKDEYVSIERLRGYREALQLYNIPENGNYIKYGAYTYEGGYLCAKELLQGNEPPTALYVTNYNMTYGALMAIRELNMDIPGQISVIGFDYSEIFELIKPELTIIEQPIEKMGEAAASMILKRIRGDYSDFPKKLEINTRLLLRNSIRKI